MVSSGRDLSSRVVDTSRGEKPVLLAEQSLVCTYNNLRHDSASHFCIRGVISKPIFVNRPPFDVSAHIFAQVPSSQTNKIYGVPTGFDGRASGGHVENSVTRAVIAGREPRQHSRQIELPGWLALVQSEAGRSRGKSSTLPEPTAAQMR